MRWEAGRKAVASVNRQSRMLGLAAFGWLRVCVRTGGRLGHPLAPWPWPLMLQIFICEMQIQECSLGPSCHIGPILGGRLFIADKMNFLRLADLLNIRVVAINIKKHPLETWMPRIYQSSTSLLVQKMVQHRQVRWSRFSLKLLSK